jgi:hypothetical protein
MTINDILLHNIANCEYSPEVCALSVMCYGMKFQIFINLHHISNNSILANDFRELAESLEFREDEDNSE